LILIKCDYRNQTYEGNIENLFLFRLNTNKYLKNGVDYLGLGTQRGRVKAKGRVSPRKKEIYVGLLFTSMSNISYEIRRISQSNQSTKGFIKHRKSLVLSIFRCS